MTEEERKAKKAAYNKAWKTRRESILTPEILAEERAKRLAYQRDYYARMTPEQRASKRESSRLSVSRQTPEKREARKSYQREYSRNYERTEEQRSKAINRQRGHGQRTRAEVIEAYGGKCACCSEHRINFLAIDHINGGGNEHRRQVGFGQAFYRWLKKNEFPSGFRVLCHNCNTSYGLYGFCPHTSEV